MAVCYVSILCRVADESMGSARPVYVLKSTAAQFDSSMEAAVVFRPARGRPGLQFAWISY
jgi:hypothetical protein